MADADKGTGIQMTGGGAVAIDAPVAPYLEGLGRLSIARQAGLIVGLAATVALAVWLVLWTREADMRPLYGSMENLDAPAVVGILESNQIAYRIDEANGMLLVEEGRYNDARLKLAEAGMAGDSAVGFELLDRDQGLGSSQFMEGARFRRSLEGELARTISSITSVRNARVHLAIPERSVFVRDQRKPSASVLLDVVAGRTVEDNQVRAIGNLVASSVPDLDLSAVTIVDQRGRLLSNFAQDGEAVLASKQLEYTRKMEQQLVERVHRILEPVVGAGRYKAEVTADVDFTAVEQADEVYNPDMPAIRSEQRMDEERSAGEAGGGVPGALSNQPPAEGQAPEVATAAAPGAAAAGGAGGAAAASAQPAARSGNVRTQSTRNYELDRTLSYTRHQVGKLRRVSVAVVLDDRLAVDAASGERRSSPWDAAALERITLLVRDAVGYDSRRGDSVNVVNTAFFDIPEGDEEIPAPPLWEQPWFWPAVRTTLGALGVLILLLGIVRPVMRSLSSNARQMRALEERHRMERMVAEQAAKPREEDVAMLPPPKAEYERRMSAVQGLVENDAEKVAQVVRKWVRENE